MSHLSPRFANRVQALPAPKVRKSRDWARNRGRGSKRFDTLYSVTPSRSAYVGRGRLWLTAGVRGGLRERDWVLLADRAVPASMIWLRGGNRPKGTISIMRRGPLGEQSLKLRDQIRRRARFDLDDQA